MNMSRKAKQVLNWTPGRKRGRGRLRKNWPETIYEDLRILELTWEDALDAVGDRDGWRDGLRSKVRIMSATDQ